MHAHVHVCMHAYVCVWNKDVRICHKNACVCVCVCNKVVCIFHKKRVCVCDENV